ncbi:MAG: hypothetical protein BWX64_02210 [Acidobacteria bacterium ADurb.Bin051]|jgi:hypothetical protein|nr:MAG: hypothetical protein BWX64_02210 [Acidobacteria bacterium ADurb.Bin051]
MGERVTAPVQGDLLAGVPVFCMRSRIRSGERERRLGSGELPAGMVAAEDRARLSDPGWPERALAAMLEAGRRLGRFTVEDARQLAGVEAPTDQRAWGAVVNRASRRGLIRRVGFAPARSSNGSPKPVWEVTA